MKEYNGKVDLLKLIFAFFIMTLHYKWRPVLFCVGNHQIILAQSGYYAVVFFFIVSGALFCISAHNKQLIWSRDMSLSQIASDTQNFIIRKYLTFIPWYLFALFIYICVDLIIDLVPIKRIISNVFWSIPSCLLLGYTGFDNKEVYQGGYYVGASWYISALMFMYCIFFPIIRWSYDVFVKIITPILIVCMLYINLSILHTNLTDSRLYSFIPFLLGIMIGDFAIKIDERLEYKLRDNIVCTVIEIMGYAVLAMFLCVNYSESMPLIEYPLLFIVGFSVLLSVCKANTPKIYDNKIFKILGKLSMIVYMIHIPIGLFCGKLIEKKGVMISNNWIYFISVVCTLLISYISCIISEKIRRLNN